MSRSTPVVVRLRAGTPVQDAPAEGRLPALRNTLHRGRTSKSPGLVVLLAAIALLAALILATRGAWAGGGPAPPATGAASVIPGDALAYVHVSTDPRRSADRQALSLARRFPDYALASGAVLARLDAILGGAAPTDFQTQIRPWLGDEAALAMLNTASATSESLIVLDVRDRARAQSFLERAGARAAGSYGDAPVYRYSHGVEAAFAGHYLVVGEDTSVRAAIDAASGRAPSLAHDDSYEQASAGEPAGRVIDLYASRAGVQRLLAPQHGIIGALGALMFQPALAGVTVSLAPASGGIRVSMHSALVPSLAALHSSRPRALTPTLPSQIPSGSTLMLDSNSLDAIVPRVLIAASATGVGSQIGPLLSRLGAALGAQGVNVQNLLSIFNGESAVALVPTQSETPALIVLARTQHPQRAQAALAALETPLAELFAPPGSGAGQAPVFMDRALGGTSVHVLSLAPGLQFDYAVSRGLLIVSTSIGGIKAILARGRALERDALYRAAVANGPAKSTSLVFLDFSQLLSLGEQTGLARSRTYGLLRADLQKIRAIGLRSTSGKTDSTAELFLQIS